MDTDDNTLPEDLRPHTLDDATLLEIGRLVRSFANIEDALTTFIYALGGKGSQVTRVLLGKTPYGKRKTIATHLVRASVEIEQTSKILAIFETPELERAQGTRNIVTHGVLAGITPDGLLWFLTDAEDKEPLTYERSVGILPEVIPKSTAWVDFCLAQLEPYLKLEAWLETRRRRPRAPLPKSQNSRAKGAVRPSPPRPSTA